jgi:hypothetical protein
MNKDPQSVKIVLNKVELIAVGIMLGAALKLGEVLLIKILLA